MEKKMSELTDKRLLLAASFVRRGAVFCDVGTDHAYLPVYLCRTGIVSSAVATDIADGPVRRARENVHLAGLDGTVAVLQTDGLHGTEEYAPTDIAVCGMGGELIARILGECTYVRERAPRLILQPMTMQPTLRRWLYEHGFTIETENVAKEKGHIYPVLCCRYTGENEAYTAADIWIGRAYYTRTDDPLTAEYLQGREKTLREIVEGRHGAGQACPEEEAALEAARELRKRS